MNDEKCHKVPRQYLSDLEIGEILMEMFSLFESHNLGVNPCAYVIVNFILNLSDRMEDPSVISDKKDGTGSFAEMILATLSKGMKVMDEHNAEESEKNIRTKKNPLMIYKKGENKNEREKR